ncbi:hypothetical protein M3Y95_00765900 [Aphelenchoides besseyi]|nr:hypothetical protein M3Y95_00765900 [Aphelenchoides besseyi]
MRASIVLLGLVSALAMLEMGWALRCYKGDCPSTDENCKYEIKECLPQEDVCYTENISDGGNLTINKDCRQDSQGARNQSKKVFVWKSVASLLCSLLVVKMRASIVLLGLVSVLAMLEMGWALKCYECYTRGKPQSKACDNATVVECSAGNKCSTTIYNDTRGGVDKFCTAHDYEGCSASGYSNQCLCNTDLCNSSDRPAIAAIGLFVLLFVFA